MCRPKILGYVIVELVFLLLFPGARILAEEAPVVKLPAGHILKIGVNEPILTRDPQKAYDPGSLVIANAVGETLYRCLASGDVEPLLAAGMPDRVSDDRYRISLNPRATFQNGVKIMPQDIIFTFQRLRNKQSSLPAGPLFSRIRAIEQSGETSIDCTFRGSGQELVKLLSRTEMVVFSHEQLASFGQAGLMGSGRYILKDWRRDETISLKKNDTHWTDQLAGTPDDLSQRGQGEDNRVNRQSGADSQMMVRGEDPGLSLSQISIVMIKDGKALYQKLMNNSIHIALGLQAEYAARIATTDKQFKRALFPSHKVYQLYLNRACPPLNTAEARQALSRVLDRQQIVQRILFGLAQTLDSPLLPGMIDDMPAEIKNIYTHQPERLPEIIQKLVITDEAGPIPLKLIVAHHPIKQAMAQEIQRQCAAIGIPVTVSVMPKKELLRLVYQKGQTESCSWHIALEDWHDWRMPSNPIDYLQLQYHSGSKYNKTAFSDPTVDDLFEDETDKQRETLLPVLQKISKDCATIPLVSPYFIVGYSAHIRDLAFDNLGTLFLEKCWLDE